MSTYYLLVVVGDLEPFTIGPFKTEWGRDRRARRERDERGDEDGIYALDIGPGGQPYVRAYANYFFSVPQS
jgi:hypothetical protein